FAITCSLTAPGETASCTRFSPTNGRQVSRWSPARPARPASGIIWQAVHHGLRGGHGSLARTHDHAETAPMRRDTPHNTGKIPDQKPQRLNNKLSENRR